MGATPNDWRLVQITGLTPTRLIVASRDSCRVCLSFVDSKFLEGWFCFKETPRVWLETVWSWEWKRLCHTTLNVFSCIKITSLIKQKRKIKNQQLLDSQNTWQAAALCFYVFTLDRKSGSQLSKDVKEDKYLKWKKNRISSRFKRSSVSFARRRNGRLAEKCQIIKRKNGK